MQNKNVTIIELHSSSAWSVYKRENTYQRPQLCSGTDVTYTEKSISWGKLFPQLSLLTREGST